MIMLEMFETETLVLLLGCNGVRNKVDDEERVVNRNLCFGTPPDLHITYTTVIPVCSGHLSNREKVSAIDRCPLYRGFFQSCSK